MFLLKDVNELYDAFSNKVAAPGNLDQKTKELIAIACSVVADCTPCIEWHHGRAVRLPGRPARRSPKHWPSPCQWQLAASAPSMARLSANSKVK